MLPEAEVDRALDEARNALATMRENLELFDTADVFAHTRSISDVLTTLVDKAPANRHDAINYLIDRCEALMKGIAN